MTAKPMGGSRLPCRGQVAPHSALHTVLRNALSFVNGDVARGLDAGPLPGLRLYARTVLREIREMKARFITAVTAPVAFQLKSRWRSTVTILLLGFLAVALLSPARTLAGTAKDGTPALTLPELPSAGRALMWTESAHSPAETQRRSLQDLMSLLSALAWIGFAVAGVSIFSCYTAGSRERALDTGVRRAVGASIRQIVWSLCLETVVLAAIALVVGLAVGGVLLSLARHQWPGAVAALVAADPAPLLALAAVLGAAGLTSLRLVSVRDMVAPPSQEVGLGVPTYQVAVSVTLLMGAAALLGNPSTDTGRTGRSTGGSAEVFRIDSGEAAAPDRGRRYGMLLDAVGGLPGVGRVSLTSAGAPLGLGTSDVVTTDCGRCFFGLIQIRWPGFVALSHAVSADTFGAHGIPVLSGRTFTAADSAGAPRVAIVNRHLASRYYQNGEALGRDIFLGAGWPKTPYTVIGIVEDDRSKALGGAIQPRETLYLSVLQHPPAHAELLIEPAGSIGTLRREVLPIVADVLGQATPVVGLGTLTQFRASQRRAISWFGVCLAVSAVIVLIMALIGTTATARMWSDSMAWEIALRRGVGASRLRMAGFILRRTATVGMSGAVIGLFLYAVVLAPALAKAMPGIPLAEARLLAWSAGLPMLLALLAAVAPGLRLLQRPPSWLLR